LPEEFGKRASVDADFADRAAVCFDFAARFGAGPFFAPGEEFANGFAAMFGLGMARLFRFEESHHGAVERVAVIGAKTVSAEGATRAAVPKGGGRAGLHECDAERHEERRKMEI
jgi:hypothetical protein